MKDGHAEYGEIFVALLIVVGIVAASVFFLPGMKGDTGTVKNSGLDVVQAATGNTTEPTGVSKGNESNINQTSPAVAPLNITNKTTDELINEGFGRAFARFSGTQRSEVYSSASYSWTLLGNESPDSIPVKENDLRVSVVRFNGKYVDSLRGFGFVVFTPPQAVIAPQKIKATAIFLSNNTDLDSFFKASTMFIVNYDPFPLRSQTIEGCKVVSDPGMMSVNGSSLKIYDIDCDVMYTTHP